MLLAACSQEQRMEVPTATPVIDQDETDTLTEQVYAGGTPTPEPTIIVFPQDPSAEEVIEINAEGLSKKMNQHMVCLLAQFPADETWQDITASLSRLYPAMKFSTEDVSRIYGRISEEQSWCADLNEQLLVSFYEMAQSGQVAWDNDTYLAYLHDNALPSAEGVQIAPIPTPTARHISPVPTAEYP